MAFNVAKIASARASLTISLTKSLRVAGPLDAGKAPYFDREVRVRIYTYRSRNGFGISYVYIRTKVRKG